jgi:hypothetical protein
MNGSLFKVMAKHMAMPDDMPSAADWGEESYVEQQFKDEIDWSFSREIVTFRSDSVEDWIAYNELKLGPMVMAKAALEPQGKWDALRADLAEHYERFNVSTDGRFAGEAEYLLAVGTLPG